MAVNVAELERALARWRGELEQVRRSGPPDAESLATHWAGLPRAKDYRRAAQRRVEERQQQAAVLQQRIDECAALIRLAVAVQAQVREQEPTGKQAQKAPEAPESPQPYKSPYPRPKYPAPGGG